jgi:hypothetical protein
MGRALASANMTIWGDKDTVERIRGAFMNGQAAGSLVSGLTANLPEPLKKLLEQYLPGDGKAQAAAEEPAQAEEVEAEEEPAASGK